jgi:hypothetical protein
MTAEPTNAATARLYWSREAAPVLSVAAPLSTGDAVSEPTVEVDEESGDELSATGSCPLPSPSGWDWAELSDGVVLVSVTAAVEVAAPALTTVNVTVVVTSSLAATARIEGERMRAKAAKAVVNRILER